MRKLFFSKVALLILALAVTVVSCKKEQEQIKLEEQGSIEFSFTTNSGNKFISKIDAPKISSAIITIEDEQGNTIKQKHILQLFNFNGYYISEAISFTVGNYKLTEFYLVDENDNILYASPKNGSKKAYLVSNPLPINFAVNKDEVSKVIPEVLSTLETTPADFGYSTFSFDVVETLDFLVSVMVYNDDVKNFELTTAQLKITNGSTELFNKGVDAITNKVTVKDGLSQYTVSITKTGYQEYTSTFTQAELKSFFINPLVVTLQKINKIVLQPGPDEAKDGHLWSCRPDEKRGNYYFFEARAWTWNGQGDGSGSTRSLLDFDFSLVPSGAIIKEATLYLYHSEYSDNSGSWHSKLSGTNKASLKRITSNWSEQDVTWNNQPTTTELNKVVVPESASEKQDYEIDVTSLVQDIVNNPATSFGFMLKLDNETPYRALVFTSSDDSLHPELWPKIEIEF